MTNVREDLIDYGVKIANKGLVAGAGGNISARADNIVWMKPSGFAMDDMEPEDLCGMDLETGEQVKGTNRPTSEVNMHLGIYRVRPEVNAVFHTHSPWASGVFSSGIELRPMFAEFVNDLGTVGTVDYITPTTRELAVAMSEKASTCDTIFMTNHGVLAVGVNMKQAYYRVLIVEDAAKSLVAATIVGTPQFLSKEHAADLMKQDAPRHRVKMMQENRGVTSQ